ncbi:MAG: NAD+ synthase [Anaerolineales bacterium]|nr:MAG: NAD+ synthase [Anaerolineales bacterium]
MQRLRIGLAQINTTVGDLRGNTARVTRLLQRARECQVDLVLFPELAISGYPPEDLLLKPSFIEANRACLDELLPHTQGLTAVVGFVDVDSDIFNAAAVLHDGRVEGLYHKVLLPNYAVFDEVRYFKAGEGFPLFELDGIVFGVSVCEDIWYPAGPPERQAAAGAELLVNISASPYHLGKIQERERMLATRAADNVAVVAFCNQVGGQDELVFDGSSVIVDERGQVIARGQPFAEDFVVADVDMRSVFRQRLHDPRRRKGELAHLYRPDKLQKIHLPGPASPISRTPLTPVVSPLPDRLGEVYQALLLGTRDYVQKNGFQTVVVGLSGGIDSSLVATIAVDALGAENVVGVSMPSRYSSDHSLEDAGALAEALGIRYECISIEPAFRSYLEMLSQVFADTQPDVAEENLQARARGNVLMALSNKFGWLVLTTGNKSEMAVGYATLYGDMAGGFAVIKDVPKTLVYELAVYRNQTSGPVIPERVLTKAPSAELRPNQKDSDSLPEYADLDAILHAYVEEDRGFHEMRAMGFDKETVRRVIRLVYRNEYKRRQAPPGVRVTARAFGKDRRLPITNKYQTAEDG